MGGPTPEATANGDLARSHNGLQVTTRSGAQWIDRAFRSGAAVCAASVLALILGVAISLVLGARANLAHSGFAFLWSARWDPVPPSATRVEGNIFGALPFIYGTAVTSALALFLAVPVGVGAAVFLAEFAPKWVSSPVSFLIEMLAAVPSIVYGFWALLYVVPLLQYNVERWLTAHFGDIPLFAAAPDSGSGLDLFAAGLILALMILPFITAVSRDVIRAVPPAQRLAARGLGATKWEAVTGVVVKHASGGILGAIMLGLGRAIGETMAVTLVVGSRVTFPTLRHGWSFSLFRPGYTMTSLLVDQYPSPNSALHASALTEIALTLFGLTIVVNALARVLVWMTAESAGRGSGNLARRARGWALFLLRQASNSAVAAILLYQLYADVRARGASGTLSGAGLLIALVACIWLANRLLPGRRFFLTWRRLSSAFGSAAAGLSALAACAALAALLLYVARSGIGALNAQFFRPPNPVDPDAGGMLHAIVGTMELVLMSSCIGVPIGVLGGIFLAEFGDNRLGFACRFSADLLNGVPSIVLGIFAFALIVVPTHRNFGYAGAFALGMLMIPTVMRTTEELVRLVPRSLRDGSLALGATRARTIWQVVLPVARRGIVTAILLGVARVAGETAPLLMVACNSELWNVNPRGGLASMPMEIYVLRDAPTSLALQQSWGVALVLVLLVLILNLLARLLAGSRMTKKA